MTKVVSLVAVHGKKFLVGAGALVAGGVAFAQTTPTTYSTITTADAQLITAGVTNNLSVIVPVILALLGITVGVMWGIRKLRSMSSQG
jgi:hypothetical protein